MARPRIAFVAIGEARAIGRQVLHAPAHDDTRALLDSVLPPGIGRLSPAAEPAPAEPIRR